MLPVQEGQLKIVYKVVKKVMNCFYHLRGLDHLSFAVIVRVVDENCQSETLLSNVRSPAL